MKPYIVNRLVSGLLVLFGISLKTGRPVLQEISDRFPATEKMAASGMFS